MKMVHVTIMTDRMEESVDFYEKIVNLKIVRDSRGSDHPIVFMRENEGDTCIELVENQVEPYQGSGISIGFPVEDAVGMRTRLEGMGWKPGPVISPNPKVQFFFVNDPNGVAVQFLQEEAVHNQKVD